MYELCHGHHRPGHHVQRAGRLQPLPTLRPAGPRRCRPRHSRRTHAGTGRHGCAHQGSGQGQGLRLHHGLERRRRQLVRGLYRQAPGATPTGGALRQRLELGTGCQQHREHRQAPGHRLVHACRELGRNARPATGILQGVGGQLRHSD
ncbi:hypothetical protein G6F31_018570 [Rhizopus arrhizus]|nr:hypothetical protein G6F31_018570 [Rhizopus arrhizus]